MILQKNLFYITGIVAIFFLFLSTAIASAVEVSPLRQTIVVDPGGSSIINIFVENSEEKSVQIIPEIESFTLDEAGRPSFNTQDDAEKWVSVAVKELSLLPHEKKIISFQISVPTFAEPGEHFLALYAKEKQPDGQIGVANRVGSLVFLHVGGVVDESIVLQEMSVPHKISFAEPIGTSIILKNVGSIHVVPEGVISVEDWRGDVVERTFINSENKKVFPNTFWKGNFSVGKNLHWWQSGPLSVKAVIVYGQSRKLLSAETHLWFFPKAFLIIFGAVLFLITSLIYFLRRSRNKNFV